MRDHSLTNRTSRAIVDLSYELLRGRFPNLDDFLERVEWTKEDLEAWVQNTKDALLPEAVTFLLMAVGVPDDRSKGPSLDSLTGKTEPERDYPASSGEIRETNSRRSSTESTISDSKAPEPTVGTDVESSAQLALSAFRKLETTLVELGLVTWDQVFAAHRKTEELYRHTHPPEA